MRCEDELTSIIGTRSLIIGMNDIFEIEIWGCEYMDMVIRVEYN